MRLLSRTRTWCKLSTIARHFSQPLILIRAPRPLGHKHKATADQTPLLYRGHMGLRLLHCSQDFTAAANTPIGKRTILISKQITGRRTSKDGTQSPSGLRGGMVAFLARARCYACLRLFPIKRRQPRVCLELPLCINCSNGFRRQQSQRQQTEKSGAFYCTCSVVVIRASFVSLITLYTATIISENLLFTRHTHIGIEC